MIYLEDELRRISQDFVLATAIPTFSIHVVNVVDILILFSGVNHFKTHSVKLVFLLQAIIRAEVFVAVYGFVRGGQLGFQICVKLSNTSKCYFPRKQDASIYRTQHFIVQKTVLFGQIIEVFLYAA